MWELLRLAEDVLTINDELLSAASKLDSFYISPRYPNAWPSDPSYVHYGQRGADEALKCAAMITELVKRRVGVEK